MRGQKSEDRGQKSEEEAKKQPQITRITQMKSRSGRRGRPPLRTSSGLCDLCGEENPQAKGRERAQGIKRKALRPLPPTRGQPPRKESFPTIGNAKQRVFQALGKTTFPFSKAWKPERAKHAQHSPAVVGNAAPGFETEEVSQNHEYKIMKRECTSARCF